MRRSRALPQAWAPPVRRLQRPHLRRSLLQRPRGIEKNPTTSMTHDTPLTALSCKPNLRAPVFSQALAGTASPSTTASLSRSPARRCLRPLTSTSINRCSSSDRGALSPARVRDGFSACSSGLRDEAASVINGLRMVRAQDMASDTPRTGLPIPKSMDMTHWRRRYPRSPTTGKS